MNSKNSSKNLNMFKSFLEEVKKAEVEEIDFEKTVRFKK